MKKIHLIDWYGHQALGDDLLHYCAWDILKKAAGKNQVEIELSGLDSADMVIIGGGTILGSDSMHILNQIESSDIPLVIFGGGFRRDQSNLMEKLKNVTGVNKTEKRELSEKNKEISRKLISRAKYMGVRGYVSRQSFIHNGIDDEKIEVIGDLGFSFEPVAVPPLSGDYKVCVSVRHMGKTGEYQHTDNRDVQRKLAGICDRLVREKNAELYFLCFTENIQDSDMKGIRNIITSMKTPVKEENIIPVKEHPCDMFSLLKQMDFIVSQRLHPSLIGWTLGVPNIAFEYHFGKTIDFINSIGMDDLLIRTDEYSEDLYFQKYERMLSHRDVLIKQSQRSIQYWKKKQADFAEKCIRLL